MVRISVKGGSCAYILNSGNTGEQIRDHKLACSIINLHGTEDEVFDDSCLEELQLFTFNRSNQFRDQMMIEKGWADKGSATYQGSLVGYLVARYGTNDEALDNKDWELLDEWFRKGKPVGQNVRRSVDPGSQ